MICSHLTYPEGVVLARLHIDDEVPGVAADLAGGHEGVRHVVGVVPLHLEVVHTLEVEHLAPAQPHSKQSQNYFRVNARTRTHLSATGRPLLSRMALILGAEVK